MNDKLFFSLERAKAAVLSRDFDLAKRIYNQILRTEPDSVEVLTQLANVHVKTGEDGAAMLLFLKILRLDVHNFNAMDNLGGIYRRLGRNQESIDILEQALKLNKNPLQIRYNLGQTYKQMGQYAEAEECFVAVIDENPHDVLAYNHLGCIYQLKKEHKKAVQTFRRALEIDPNHPILHYNTALSLAALQKNDEAAQFFENALRSRPGWGEAMAAYADLLARTKKFDNAEFILGQAKKFGITDAKIHNLQARLYYAKNNFQAAEEEFSKAVELNPKDAESLSQFGSLLSAQNKSGAALKVYEKLEILEPSNKEAKQNIVKLLMHNNEPAKAEDRLQKLTAENPDDEGVLSLQGQWHTLMGDKKKAQACFDRIAKVAPENQQFRKELAETLSNVERFDDAEINFRRYLHENPEDTDAWFKIGKVYEALNEIKKALTAYRKLLQLDPLHAQLEKTVSSLCKKTKGDPDAMRLMNELLDARSKNAEAGGDLERMLASYEQMAAMSAQNDNTAKKQMQFLDSDNNSEENSDENNSADSEIPAGQALGALTIDEDITKMDLSLHTSEEDEEELDFSTIQENIDNYMEQTDHINSDLLVSQDAPLDSEMLRAEKPTEFGQARSNETLEEEEVLDLGGGNQQPEEVIEERHEIEEQQQDERPEQVPPPLYPNYPQYPPYPPFQPPEPQGDFEKKPSPTAPIEEDPIDEEELIIDEPVEEQLLEDEAVDDDMPIIDEEAVVEEEPVVDEDSEEDKRAAAEELAKQEELERKKAELEAMRKKVRQALDNVRESETPVKTAKTAEMFEYIRGMCSHLPPMKKEAFEGSENRMYLEYVINKLRGKPGLMTETKTIENLVPHEGQMHQNAQEETPISLDSIGNTFGYLRKLSFELPDKKLASALDNSVSKVLSHWKSPKK